MKTRTAAEATTLQLLAGYGVEVRVKVANSAGTLQDISSYVLNTRYEASWDTPVSQCTVECARVVGGVSLAPDDSSSSLNALGALLAHWRLFTLEVATVPLGTARSSITGWREEFRGRVDDFTVGDDSISVKVLDEGARLQRAHIDAERTYGSDAGTAVQTVMASILSDNGVSWVSLTTPSSPGWLLQKYKQDKVPVLDALRKLAEQLGWEVRYWYSSSSGKVDSLRFFEPNRSLAAADFTFGPTGPCAYLESPEFRTTGEDLRNIWVGTYSDRADLDAAGVPKRKTVTRSDAPSIADNDPALAEIAEESTSNINTHAEMERLLDAGLADCKDPKRVGSLPVQYFPWVELGDVIGVLANGASLNADVLLAVEAYSHEIPLGGVPRTTLSFRGTKPTTSLLNWARRQARPAMFSNTNPANQNAGPNAPTSLSALATVNGFRLRWNPPTTGPKAESYELHVHTSSGFTPSDSTRRWVGASTEAQLADLTPGTTYYAVLVPRTSLTGGDRGTASSEVSFTAKYVEPRVLQPYLIEARMPRNGGFEAHNNASEPPDTWTMTAGTWSVDASVISGAETGTKAVRISSGSAQIACQPFTCRPGQRVSVEIYAKRSGGSAAMGIGLEWLDATLASTDVISITPPESLVNGSYVRLTGVGSTTDADARYVRVLLQSPLISSPNTMDIDSVTLDLLDPAVEAVHVLTVSPANEFQNGWTQYGAGRASAGYFKNNLGEVILRGTIKSGTIGAAAFTLPSGYRPVDVSGFVCRGNGGTALVDVASNGDVTVVSAPDSTLVDISGVRFRAA